MSANLTPFFECCADIPRKYYINTYRFNVMILTLRHLMPPKVYLSFHTCFNRLLIWYLRYRHSVLLFSDSFHLQLGSSFVFKLLIQQPWQFHTIFNRLNFSIDGMQEFLYFCQIFSWRCQSKHLIFSHMDPNCRRYNSPLANSIFKLSGRVHARHIRCCSSDR